MAERMDVQVPVGDLDLTAPGGGSRPLSALTGVFAVVLLRHRH